MGGGEVRRREEQKNVDERFRKVERGREKEEQERKIQRYREWLCGWAMGG